MFTGLIEHVVSVTSLSKHGRVWRLVIDSPYSPDALTLGESIAVNGVCLTVVDVQQRSLSFDIQKETVERTALASLVRDSKVNIERALTAGARLGGHIVQGHVDAVGTVTRSGLSGEDWILAIRTSTEFLKTIVSKGSITIDGVSLTVVDVTTDEFTVHIIPHTLKETNLHLRSINDAVNLESDIIGKYVYNYLEKTLGKTDSLYNTLMKNGFIS